MIKYTKKEEIWNTWSHAAGIVGGVVMGILFLVLCFKGNNTWASVGVILYLFGMMACYVASTAYHATPRTSKWKERLRKWDHAAIYWHIAGSYSPLTLVALRQSGGWGWGLFIFVWVCAIVGTVMSFVKLKDHSNLETLCFVGMGLSVLVAFKPLIDCVSTATVGWIIALYHWRPLLSPKQPRVYALGVSFLCANRQCMPYRGGMGCVDGLSVIDD